MPQQIVEAVLAGGYLFLKLLVGKLREALVETTDDELPGIQHGDGKELLIRHKNLLSTT
jgi:hypothetical protein